MCKSDSVWILKPHHHINSIMTSITLGRTKSGITGGLCAKCTAVFGPSHAVAWPCLTAGWQIRRRSVRRCRFGQINRFPRESTVNRLTLLGRFESAECPEWKQSHRCVLAALIVYTVFPSYIPPECVLAVSWPCGRPYPSNRCYQWFLPHVQFGDPPGMHPLCVSSLLCGCVSNWPPWMHCSVLDTRMWDIFFLFIWKSPFKGSLVSFFLQFLVCVATYLWSDGAYLAPLCTVFQ